jgi:hypothetical protein
VMLSLRDLLARVLDWFKRPDELDPELDDA